MTAERARDPGPASPGNTKAIVTMATGPHRELLDIALPTFTRFAETFGYDIIVGTGTEAAPRPSAWSKIPLLARALDDYDTVLWLDADTVVVSFDTDLADCVEDDAYQALAVTEWGRELRPNTGVWLLRSGERAARFLDAVWDSEQFIDDRWWENAAVVTLLGYSMWPCLPGPPTEWTQGTTVLAPEWNAHSPLPERSHRAHPSLRRPAAVVTPCRRTSRRPRARSAPGSRDSRRVVPKSAPDGNGRGPRAARCGTWHRNARSGLCAE